MKKPFDKEVLVMVKFVDNVNKYITQMKIKKSYISLKSGIDASKLSRILSKNQEINANEMGIIADALGQKIEFFLTDPFVVPQKEISGSGEIAFYAGEPKKEQEDFAKKLMELIENADEILSAKNYYMMIPGEW